MSYLTLEQVLAAQKANIDVLFGLTHKAFEGVEKLVDLNLKSARAAIVEANETAKIALSAKDAQELMTLQTSLLQPAAEKLAAYNRHVYDIAAAAGAEISKVAETTATEAQAKFLSVVDAAAKNAPAGSEKAVEMVKTAIANANTAFEGVQKAVKQATDAAEANLKAISATATKATATATKAKRTA